MITDITSMGHLNHPTAYLKRFDGESLTTFLLEIHVDTFQTWSEVCLHSTQKITSIFCSNISFFCNEKMHLDTDRISYMYVIILQDMQIDIMQLGYKYPQVVYKSRVASWKWAPCALLPILRIDKDQWWYGRLYTSAHLSNWHTSSCRSFCTPYLPPNPLVESVWDSCLDSSAW